MKFALWMSPLLLAAIATPSVQAQNLKLRPGLWELQTQMKTGSGRMENAMAQMQQQLASMPPAQRKQMEEMMAKQGVSLPTGGGNAHTLKVCMTQQDVDLDQVQMREGCTQKVARTGAKTLTMTFQCPAKGDEPATSGEGTMTLESDTAYSGQHHMVSRMGGQTEKMEMTQKGRWLGADCGTIKPMPR